MRSSNLLFSAVQFLITVAILLAGFFFICLPSSPHVQGKLASFFTERSDLFLFIGTVLLSIGGVLLISFYAMNRRSYYQVAMQIDVQPVVIQQLLEGYWKTAFPQQKVSLEVAIRENKIVEMIVKSPILISKEELEKIEKEVGNLLSTHLGYNREFLLTVMT